MKTRRRRSRTCHRLWVVEHQLPDGRWVIADWSSIRGTKKMAEVERKRLASYWPQKFRVREYVRKT